MACVGEGAPGDETLKQPAVSQELAERRQMAVHGDAGAVIPSAFAGSSNGVYLLSPRQLEFRVPYVIFFLIVYAVLRLPSCSW